MDSDNNSKFNGKHELLLQTRELKSKLTIVLMTLDEDESLTKDGRQCLLDICDMLNSKIEELIQLEKVFMDTYHNLTSESAEKSEYNLESISRSND